MLKEETTATPPPSPPHILIFPVPLQGHVNSMLNLSEILCLSGLHVTILLSDHTHDRLLRHASLRSRFSRYAAFRVATISDGLPADHPRSGQRILEIVLSLKEVGGPQFRRLMEGLSDGGGGAPRVSCLIMDGVLSFTIPVVEEMGIPFIYFRTISACSFWPYFCIQEMIDAGEVPLKDKNEDKLTYWKRKEMDLMVTSVPGMENLLRRRDIPAFCRVEDVGDAGFQSIKTETRRTTQAAALILNTFEDLEGPILDQIRKHIPNLYSIGPLHSHLKALLKEKGMESSHHSSSFWKEDDSCMGWLDSQPPKSVIYVSFGSITMLTRDELLEFWYGLVNSGVRFLWVVRPDSVVEDRIGNGCGNEIPVELVEGTKLRGLMVEWVPQEVVLGHPSVGAFFTHSGWNSTLESVVIGLPMLCWPYFADQTTNSRFVSEVWGIGLDIKDTCDRLLIERMVKEVMMGVRRDELLEKARGMANMANKAICEGGSSHMNLNRLIEFLKSTAL
ncbi:7-deoxyloganetic acid glucosyl transferase-like [Salvia miltiorrhiza]|uniref:7-deoxyloganetic acid glucosyl transferase-like n=1 Tax=Salvia miltiorrhiza TaxID=226208 RepID=UPI0025ACAA71|nr:7-deoxyloganetic acid glucosyl transferase-like [Salvia miltiorrhiza]